VLETLTRDFWGTPTSSSLSHKSYRPLTSFVYRVLWMFGGDPAPFHWALVLGNALCAVLVVRVVLVDCDPVCRVVAALIYTCHPIKTESVNGVVGMAEIISTLLCLCAYSFACKGRPIVASLLCFAASMAKETGISGALLIALYYWSQWKRTHRWKRTLIVPGLAFGLFFVTRFVLFGADNWSIQPSVQDNPMLLQSGVMWVANALVVQAEYIRLLAFPITLSCDYSFNAFPLAESLADVRVLGSVMVACVFLWGAYHALRSSTQGLLLAYSWYVAPMLPATHIMVIGTLVAERLLYLPLLGWSLVLGTIGSRWAGTQKNRQVIVLLVVVVLCIALSARTMARNPDWSKNEVLFERTVVTSPKSIKALMNLAGLMFANRNATRVLEYTQRVEQIDKKYCAALQLQARTYFEVMQKTEKAEKMYEKTLDCMLVQRHSSQLLAEVYEQRK
jgi:hypothetical protein